MTKYIANTFHVGFPTLHNAMYNPVRFTCFRLLPLPHSVLVLVEAAVLRLIVPRRFETVLYITDLVAIATSWTSPSNSSNATPVRSCFKLFPFGKLDVRWAEVSTMYNTVHKYYIYIIIRSNIFQITFQTWNLGHWWESYWGLVGSQFSSPFLQNGSCESADKHCPLGLSQPW